jgi:NAD(P)-dependent dehydrogenase (short-subunit alcohol dehydrogenase family)
MDFTNASAIVTGGASGLGAATARALRELGLHAVVLDLDESNGAKVAAEIGGEFARTDVRDTDQVIAAIEIALAHGPLRVAVNCAGIPSLSRTIGKDGAYDSAHSLEAFTKVIEVNLVVHSTSSGSRPPR